MSPSANPPKEREETRPSRSAEVRINGDRVGVLEEIGTRIRFTYDRKWCEKPDATPVSLTLPVTPAPFEQTGLHPFFENLLPEGWLLEISTSALKISKDDIFGLLMATCADCIGDVEIVPLE